MDEDMFACRLCSSTDDLVDVGSENTPYAPEYRNIVRIMTGIKILPNDSLLSSICRSCLKRAIENYDYRRSALQRNRELTRKRELIEAEKLKHETTGECQATLSTDIDNDNDSDVEFIGISRDLTKESAPPDQELPKLVSTTNEISTTKQTSILSNTIEVTDQTNMLGKINLPVSNEIEQVITKKTENITIATETVEAVASTSKGTNCDKVTHAKSPGESGEEIVLGRKIRAAAMDASDKIEICKETEVFNSDSDSDTVILQIPDSENVIVGQNKQQNLKQTQVEVNTEIASAIESTDKEFRFSSMVKNILNEYPNLKLPESVLHSKMLREVVVKISHKEVRRHIVKLNRRTRRNVGKKQKIVSTEASSSHQRMDIPLIMPTTSTELKQLVTSSLGLQRIGPPSPLKSPALIISTPKNPETVEFASKVPISSTPFYQPFPSINVIETVEEPHAVTANAFKTPEKRIGSNYAGFATPIDTEYTQLDTQADDDAQVMTVCPDVMDYLEPIRNEEQNDEVNTNDSMNSDSPQTEYSLIKVAREKIVYICDLCNKILQSNYSLKRHLIIHKRCIFCKKVFASINELQKHVKESCRDSKRTRKLSVNILKMETDKTITAQLPQWFFDQCAKTIKSRIDKSEINEVLEVSKRGEKSVCDIQTQEQEVSTSEIKDPEVQPENSSKTDSWESLLIPEETAYEHVKKYLPTDLNIELSDAESIHLVDDEECEDKPDTTDCILSPEDLAPALQASLDHDIDKRPEMDEAFFIQRVIRMSEAVSGNINVAAQVTPKDFVEVKNIDGALRIEGLARHMASNDVVPVKLGYKPKRLKVRVLDYKPPVPEKKFYDFSKVAPISLSSCRDKTNKRRVVYNFDAALSTASMLTLTSSASTSNSLENKEVTMKRNVLTTKTSSIEVKSTIEVNKAIKDGNKTADPLEDPMTNASDNAGSLLQNKPSSLSTKNVTKSNQQNKNIVLNSSKSSPSMITTSNSQVSSAVTPQKVSVIITTLPNQPESVIENQKTNVSLSSVHAMKHTLKRKLSSEGNEDNFKSKPKSPSKANTLPVILNKTIESTITSQSEIVKTHGNQIVTYVQHVNSSNTTPQVSEFKISTAGGSDILKTYSRVNNDKFLCVSANSQSSIASSTTVSAVEEVITKAPDLIPFIKILTPQDINNKKQAQSLDNVVQHTKPQYTIPIATVPPLAKLSSKLPPPNTTGIISLNHVNRIPSFCPVTQQYKSLPISDQQQQKQSELKEKQSQWSNEYVKHVRKLREQQQWLKQLHSKQYPDLTKLKAKPNALKNPEVLMSTADTPSGSGASSNRGAPIKLTGNERKNARRREQRAKKSLLKAQAAAMAQDSPDLPGPIISINQFNSMNAMPFVNKT